MRRKIACTPGADGRIYTCPDDVRFTLESGHRETLLGCPLCAMCGRLRVGKENLRVADLVEPAGASTAGE